MNKAREIYYEDKLMKMKKIRKEITEMQRNGVC